MFTVEMTSMPASSSSSMSCQRFAFRLPGRVGVRELVDERHLGMAGEHRVEIHLLERRAAVLDLAPRDDLEVAELLDRLRAAVGLDDADDDVGAPLGTAAALVEHVVGLAYARRGPEVDAQRASGHGWDSSPRFPRRRDRARGSARARSRRARRGTPATARRCDPRSSERTASTVMLRAAAHARRLQVGVCDRDVRVEARCRRRHRVHRHECVGRQPVRLSIRGRSVGDVVEQLLVGRPEVRGARLGGVVPITRGRRPRMEVLLAGERLADQRRARRRCQPRPSPSSHSPRDRTAPAPRPSSTNG